MRDVQRLIVLDGFWLPVNRIIAGTEKEGAWGVLCRFAISAHQTETGKTGVAVEFPEPERGDGHGDHDCGLCLRKIERWMVRARLTVQLAEPDDPAHEEPWKFRLCKYCVDDINHELDGLTNA